MSHFGLNLGQTDEDSEMFTNIWLSSIGLKCVLFNFIAMNPSDKRPRLHAFGAANKREKKRRLDNTVAA